MDYVTLEELKNSIELVGVNFADYDALKAISAASRAVENITGRNTFGTTVETRYYTPAERYVIDADSLVNVTALKTDTTGRGVFDTSWTLNTDYVLEPLNAAAYGWPYDRIRAKPYSSLFWPPWPSSVSVTGTFGFPSVPEGVFTATLIIATQTVKRMREAPFGIVGLGMDNTAVRIPRTDPQLMMHLNPYVVGAGVLCA